MSLTKEMWLIQNIFAPNKMMVHTTSPTKQQKPPKADAVSIECSAPITAVALSSDQKRAAVVDRNGGIAVWDLMQGKAIATGSVPGVVAPKEEYFPPLGGFAEGAKMAPASHLQWAADNTLYVAVGKSVQRVVFEAKVSKTPVSPPNEKL